MLNKGDDVTVVVGETLFRTRVEVVHPDHFTVQRWHADVVVRNLADEGITWVRGFHERGAPELAAMLAYIAMR